MPNTTILIEMDKRHCHITWEKKYGTSLQQILNFNKSMGKLESKLLHCGILETDDDWIMRLCLNNLPINKKLTVANYTITIDAVLRVFAEAMNHIFSKPIVDIIMEKMREVQYQPGYDYLTPQEQYEHESRNTIGSELDCNGHPMPWDPTLVPSDKILMFEVRTTSRNPINLNSDKSAHVLKVFDQQALQQANFTKDNIKDLLNRICDDDNWKVYSKAGKLVALRAFENMCDAEVYIAKMKQWPANNMVFKTNKNSNQEIYYAQITNIDPVILMSLCNLKTFLSSEERYLPMFAYPQVKSMPPEQPIVIYLNTISNTSCWKYSHNQKSLSAYVVLGENEDTATYLDKFDGLTKFYSKHKIHQQDGKRCLVLFGIDVVSLLNAAREHHANLPQLADSNVPEDEAASSTVPRAATSAFGRQ